MTFGGMMGATLKHFTQTSHAACWLAFAILAGCTRPQPGNPTGAGSRATPPPALHGGLQANAATRAYLSGLRFDDSDAALDSSYVARMDCEDDCGGGNAKMDLRIEPEMRSHEVDWHAALAAGSDSGYVVARIIKPMGRRFGPLGLRVGEDTTYLWVGPKSSSTSQRWIAWVKINMVTGAPGQFKKKRRRFEKCPMDAPRTLPRVKRATSDVDHGNCPEEEYPLVAGEVDDLSGPPFLFPPGTWMSCAGGCCQAKEQQR